MTADWLGITLGAGSGLLSLTTVSWTDVSFEDRLAIWLARTMTGWLLVHIALPIPTWATGAVLGMLLSAPSAIHLGTARQGVPLLVSGALIGTMIAMLLEWLPMLGV